MADDKSSGSWGSSVVVLAFAAVSAAYVAFQQPALVSTRPNEPEYQVHYRKGLAQDVEARLWQDPFNAVTHDLQQRRAARLADKDRDDAHSITPRFPDNCNTLALGVTLPGGPYPEAAETRRRLRYAVLAALHTEDYAPADEKHIGYFRTHEETPITQPPTQPKPQPPVTAQTTAKGSLIAYQLPPKDTKATTDNDGTGQSGGTGSNDGNGADAPLPPIIPFEQFDRYATHGCADAEPQKHIVVMWLDEDLLTAGRMPIASLDLLRSMILRSAQTTGSSLEESKFALLGPDDSTMLVAMAQEAVHPPPATAKSSQTDKPGRRHFDFTIYNFGATADDEYVRKLAGSTRAASPRYFFRRISNTISSSTPIAISPGSSAQSCAGATTI